MTPEDIVIITLGIISVVLILLVFYDIYKTGKEKTKQSVE